MTAVFSFCGIIVNQGFIPKSLSKLSVFGDDPP
jgi:hypothetical protein